MAQTNKVAYRRATGACFSSIVKMNVWTSWVSTSLQHALVLQAALRDVSRLMLTPCIFYCMMHYRELQSRLRDTPCSFYKTVQLDIAVDCSEPA